MADRHYNDDEVAAIFRTAAEGSESGTLPDSRADGLTLEDLQDIAREVGISPTAVSRAAQSLDRSREPAVQQTFLGLPIAVERTVALDRNLTDAEWELLIVQLREVFRARGVVRMHGSMREWSNGNLNAMLEPTPTGYQLRLATVKGNARSSTLVGAIMLGLATVVGFTGAAHSALADAAPGIAALTSIGAALMATGPLRLPGWARLRRRQMDAIAAQLAETTRPENRSILPGS